MIGFVTGLCVLQASNNRLQTELAKYKYPVLSEKNNWTDKKQSISPDQGTVSIQVSAEDLPKEEGFAAEIVVGEIRTSACAASEQVTVKMWLDDKTVHYSIGHIEDSYKIYEDNHIFIRIPIFTIVINSKDNGDACSGEYHYNYEKQYYEKVQSDRNAGPTYLYRDRSRGWFIGQSIDRHAWYWCWNLQRQDTVPTSGWE